MRKKNVTTRCELTRQANTMGAEVELHRLVDLALRSPEAGVVNFNHLHTLLHAILNHIGLNYKTLSGAINLPLASSNGNEKPSRFHSERSKAEEKDVTEQYNSNPGDTAEQPFGHNIALSDQERRNFARLCNSFLLFFFSMVRICK